MSTAKTETRNEYFVSYRTSADGPTSTCIARAACVADVLAFFGSRGAEVVNVTSKEDAPSWMGEGKTYSTVECSRVPVTVEFDGGAAGHGEDASDADWKQAYEMLVSHIRGLRDREGQDADKKMDDYMILLKGEDLIAHFGHSKVAGALSAVLNMAELYAPED